MLKIRKMADKSSGRREVRYDERTGESYLYNPDTPGVNPEPWPLAGVDFVGDPPSEAVVPMRWVLQGVAEGWLTLENERISRAPGGPPGNLWAKTHTFHQGDAITFHTINGDVRYKIEHNPGKYDDSTQPAGKRVDWYYRVALES